MAQYVESTPACTGAHLSFPTELIHSLPSPPKKDMDEIRNSYGLMTAVLNTNDPKLIMQNQAKLLLLLKRMMSKLDET
jgi:hypothetical protein